METLKEERRTRKEAESRLVRVDKLADFGYLRSFQRDTRPSHRREGEEPSAVAAAGDDDRNASGFVARAASEYKEWGDVRHLEVTHGGHDRVQYSEVTLRCLRDIMARSDRGHSAHPI
jgi:hypothetical protein